MSWAMVAGAVGVARAAGPGGLPGLSGWPGSPATRGLREHKTATMSQIACTEAQRNGKLLWPDLEAIFWIEATYKGFLFPSSAM
ncbi:hypothetical protein [Alicyclobacillus dauci]|uniref:Secreted protein n=1 Tax=Alicyclobacillus dauci TaxID=1475485 RepID=A0ABY6Z1U7_9BACL|nr:hypothetical protein [Alicyclobacillus dauci]WAH36878.1 hypothetical protein NZD86_22380 [Alicyclobacillus dauci]